MFGCKHKWEVLSETTTESKTEQMDRLKFDVEKATYRSLGKKLIQIVTCTECGKLKRFVEVI